MARTFLRSAGSLIIGLMIVSASAQTRVPEQRMGFVPNRGQVQLPGGGAVPEVLYLWPSETGVNVQVRATGLGFDTFGRSAPRDGGATATHMHRLDMRFLGANEDAVLVPSNTLEGRHHFHTSGTPKSGIRDVPHYGRIERQDLYPGIDLMMSIDRTRRGMKYDLIVDPEADLSQVVMEYSGFDAVVVRDRELVFDLSGRTLTESLPASWQDPGHRDADVRYVVRERSAHRLVVALEFMGERANGSTLVVDPVPHLQWGTYFGDSFFDGAHALAQDTIGMLYVAGVTGGFITTATSGGAQTTYGGGARDAFLAKIAAHGSRLWCTYYGGNGDDEAHGVIVDQDYRIYLAGTTTSDSMATDSAFQTERGGGTDAFMAVFDSSGQRVWASYIGGTLDESALGITCDASGRAWLFGSTRSMDVFGTWSGNPVGSYTAEQDAFLVRFDPEGQLERAVLHGGTGDEAFSAAVIDHDGHVYAAGSTTSPDAIAQGAAEGGVLGGGRDAFILRLDTAGQVAWSRYFGGPDDDAATGLVLVDEHIVVAGWTSSDSLATDTLVHQPLRAGGVDAVVAILDTTGLLLRCTYLGGENDDRAVGIARDTNGDLYVVGTTRSSTGIATDSAFQTMLNGDADFFACRLRGADTLIWGGYYGGVLTDSASAISVYGYTVIYLAGATNSEDSLFQNGFQPGLGGDHDALMARMLNPRSTPATGICQGGPGGPCTPGGNGGSNGGVPQNYICRGDTLHFSVSGGALAFGHYWMWYVDGCGDPQQFLAIGPTVTIVAEYDITLSVRTESALEVGSCTYLHIYVEDLPTAVATGPDELCRGTPVDLIGSGGVTHQWLLPDHSTVDSALVSVPSDSLASPALFVLTAYSQHGCMDQDSLMVIVHTPIPVPWYATGILCHGGSDGAIATDSASAALHSFHWPLSGSDAPLIGGLSAGTYIVLVTDTNGCVLPDTIVLADPPHPIDTVLVQNATCGEANGTITLVEQSGSQGLTCEWNHAPINAPVATGLEPAAYSVVVIDGSACEFSFTTLVQDTGSIAAWIIPDSTMIWAGDSLELLASHTPFDPQAAYTWMPVVDPPCTDCQGITVVPTTTAWYVVTVTNSLGCQATDSALVVVVPKPCPELFIPTHFSPNADGLNDSFGLLGGCIRSANLVVMDRDGNALFHGYGTTDRWNGDAQGHPVPSGSYEWTLVAELESGERVERMGSIILLR